MPCEGESLTSCPTGMDLSLTQTVVVGGVQPRILG
jgi:hypothetical protein